MKSLSEQEINLVGGAGIGGWLTAGEYLFSTMSLSH